MKYLKDIFYDIRKWFLTMNIKRIVIISIAFILITAPSVIAINYIINNEFLNQESVFSVALYTEKDELILYEDASADTSGNESVSDIFIELMKFPIAQSDEAADYTESRYIKAVITENSVVSELLCYFSVDKSEGYFTDMKGQRFAIPADLNERFLATEYAELFYSSALCPVLSTIDGDTILPSNVNWFYKSTSKTFLTAKKNEITFEPKSYEITGALDIRFDIAPDICRILVYQGDQCIYDGNEKELASLTVDSKDELRVTVNASWANTKDTKNYGSIQYEFLAHIKNRSAFYVDKDTVYSGSFIILDCTNITDISRIKFATDKEGISPIFRRYNGSVRTIIPFPESDTAEQFDFSVSYGASSQHFSISILPAISMEEYRYSELIFDNVTVPEGLQQSIRQKMLNTSLTYNELVYFQGNFIDPIQNGFSLAYTHNSTVKWGKRLEYSYTPLGNEYITSNANSFGASVAAVQNGLVAAIGADSELGNYVVIDHGCGLRTWYSGLDSVDVSLGDIVLAGQHIGKAGRSTFEGKEGFRLFCTVDSIIIDPNTLW